MKKKVMTKSEFIQVNLKKIHEISGMVTAREVLVYAEPEDSPLHKYFEWDDKKASHKYRLWQARELIASVRVVLEDQPFNGFYNVRVRIDDKIIQGYFTAQRVASDPVLQQKVVETALKELEYWQTKYREVLQLSKLYKTIDTGIKEFKKETLKLPSIF